jgi:hypothetical protein
VARKQAFAASSRRANCGTQDLWKLFRKSLIIRGGVDVSASAIEIEEVEDSPKDAAPLLTVAVRKALLGLEKQPEVSSPMNGDAVVADALW